MALHISNPHIQHLLQVFSTYVSNTLSAYLKSEDAEKGSFENYLSLQLWNTKGIRRAKVGDDIVLYSYRKQHPKFNPKDEITQFCRHVIFDIKNMKILSFGIPGSGEFEEHFEQYPKTKFNAKSNGPIEDFKTGSMIIENPSISTNERFYQKKIKKDEDDDEDETNVEDIQVPEFKDISISTRNKIGTSNFNSGYTFADIFNANNRYAEVKRLSDIGKLGEDMCLIWNSSFKDEQLTDVSENTLTAAYYFGMKTDEECQISWQNVLDAENDENRLNACQKHFENLIISRDLTEIKKLFSDNGCGNIKIPEQYKFKNLEELKEYVFKQPFTFQGLTIWTLGGVRVKVINPAYEYVRDLSGNECIQISKGNERNLYKLWHHLLIEKKLEEFMKYYDKKGIYRNIFQSYYIKLNNFVRELFESYQSIHVKKPKKQFSEVPFRVRDLCYQLHGDYKNSPLDNKVIITPKYVKNFVIQMGDKIYNRIFNPLTEAPIKEIVEPPVVNVEENQIASGDDTVITITEQVVEQTSS